MLPSTRVGDPERYRAAMAQLGAIPVVKHADADDKWRNGRVICWSLWCGARHAQKDKQPVVALNDKPLTDPTAVPPPLQADAFDCRPMWRIDTWHCVGDILSVF